MSLYHLRDDTLRYFNNVNIKMKPILSYMFIKKKNITINK